MNIPTIDMVGTGLKMHEKDYIFFCVGALRKNGKFMEITFSAMTAVP